LKKKKQKNFAYLRAAAPPTPMPQSDKSFLLLFFKKEGLPLLPLKITTLKGK
jgi:hypothetical protein